jgi:hypothetical protein
MRRLCNNSRLAPSNKLIATMCPGGDALHVTTFTAYRVPYSHSPRSVGSLTEHALYQFVQPVACV